MTMDIGQLITIALNVLSIVGGGLYALAKVESKLSVLGSAHEAFVDRMSKVEGKLDQLGSAFIQFARQETRIDNQDKRLQELSDRLDELSNRLNEQLTMVKTGRKR